MELTGVHCFGWPQENSRHFTTGAPFLLLIDFDKIGVLSNIYYCPLWNQYIYNLDRGSLSLSYTILMNRNSNNGSQTICRSLLLLISTKLVYYLIYTTVLCEINTSTIDTRQRIPSIIILHNLDEHKFKQWIPDYM